MQNTFSTLIKKIPNILSNMVWRVEKTEAFRSMTMAESVSILRGIYLNNNELKYHLYFGENCELIERQLLWQPNDWFMFHDSITNIQYKGIGAGHNG